MVMDKERDTAMNYLHIIIITLPDQQYTHAHSPFHAHTPATLHYISCLFFLLFSVFFFSYL